MKGKKFQHYFSWSTCRRHEYPWNPGCLGRYNTSGTSKTILCGGSSQGSKEVEFRYAKLKFLFLIYFIGPIPHYGPAHSLDDSIFTPLAVQWGWCPEGDALAQGTIDTELLRRNSAWQVHHWTAFFWPESVCLQILSGWMSHKNHWDRDLGCSPSIP